MSRRSLLLLMLLLAGCAARTPLPSAVPSLGWPLQLHIQREQGGQRQDWLLVVQEQAGALRWSLFDPLGIPLARQRLEQQSWHNDGLLPPNPEARELFAALLFALTPAAELAQRYPVARWQANDAQRQLLDGRQPRWRVRYHGPLNIQLSAANGPNYRVTALPAHERGNAP